MVSSSRAMEFTRILHLTFTFKERNVLFIIMSLLSTYVESKHSSDWFIKMRGWKN